MRKRLALCLLPLAAAAALGFGLTGMGAAHPEGDEHHSHDKHLRKGLIEAMQRGVYLYNNDKNYAGCYHVFEGALLTAKPSLHHHPELQKDIDAGLKEAERMAQVWERALVLRKVLDKVTDKLGGKTTNGKDKDAPKDDKDGKKDDKDGKPVDDKKTDKKADGVKDKPATDKKADGVKDKPATDKKADGVKDKTGDKNKKEVKKELPPNHGAINGKVTYKDQALSIGFVTFVGEDMRTYSANIVPGGNYAINKGIPAGKYKVLIEKSTAVPGKGQTVIAIPERYASVDATPLEVTIAAGKNQINIKLED